MIHLNAYIVDIPVERFEELHDAIIEAIEGLDGGMYAVWELYADEAQDEPTEVPHEA